MTDIVQIAIDKAGGLNKLAEAVGIKSPSVIGWRYRGIIPRNRLNAVAAATGMTVEQLRPDLAQRPAQEVVNG